MQAVLSLGLFSFFSIRRPLPEISSISFQVTDLFNEMDSLRQGLAHPGSLSPDRSWSELLSLSRIVLNSLDRQVLGLLGKLFVYIFIWPFVMAICCEICNLYQIIVRMSSIEWQVVSLSMEDASCFAVSDQILQRLLALGRHQSHAPQ